MEKKENAMQSNANVTEVKEVVTKEQRQLEEILSNQNLIKTDIEIQRELYKERESDGLKFYAYFIKAKFNKLEKKINLKPSQKDDFGAFDYLDLMFEMSGNIYLGVKSYKMLDDNTGQISEGVTYEAYADERSFQLRPAKKSDKAFLDELIKMNLAEKANKAS